MKGLRIALVIFLLFPLLAGLSACHLLLPLGASTMTKYPAYLATAEIYRSLPGGIEFIEKWQMYGWPPPADRDGDGDVDFDDTKRYFSDALQQYISDFMAPGFTWNVRNLNVVADPTKMPVGDCSSGSTGVPLDPPLAYGAPLGAEIVWTNPPVSQYWAVSTLFYKDGSNGIATPQIRKAVMRFAERGGLPNMWTGVYDPDIRHLRFSDMYVELADFDLDNPDDAHVRDVYYQSFGTAFARGVGIPNYDFKTYDDAVFFLNANGNVADKTGTTQICFNNSQIATVYERQNSLPIFYLTLTATIKNTDGDTIADVNFHLESPEGNLFAKHQPYLELADRETANRLVTLTPDVALDRDNDLDRFLWFQDFEKSGSETFLGQGQTLTDVPFNLGDHRITVVAYDKRGAYNSATMTLSVVTLPPVALCQDVTVPAGAACTAAASVDNGSYDPEGGALTYTQTPPGPYPLGATPVVLEVADPDGGKASCAAVVTVEDVTPPAVSCPANVTVNATSPAGAAVVFPMATASDNCSGSLPSICTPASGSTFAIGTNSVTCSASDLAGNTGSCAFIVKVKGAAEQTADLIEIVEGLTAPKLDPGIRVAMIAKLNAALAAMDPLDTALACQALQDFINMVKAQTGKRIYTADGAVLISEATRIMAVLGCS